MRTQRVRAGKRPTPSRHNIRSRMAEFDETDNAILPQRQASAPIGGPQALPGVINDDGTMVLQPDPLVASRVEQDVMGIRAYDASENIILNVDTSAGTILAKGNITGGSIILDDTADNNTYWYMADNVGLTSRTSDADVQSTSFRSSYVETTPGVHDRQLLMSVQDVDAPYGTNVGRSAFIQIYQSKIEGSESSIALENRSMILLRAAVNDTADEVVAFIAAANDTTTFQVQGATDINLIPLTGGVVQLGEQVQITGDPYHVTSPLAVSNYADGCRGWYIESTSDSASFGATAETILSGLNDVPVIPGRKYKVTYYSRTMNVPVSGDEIEVFIERDQGGGFDLRIGDMKVQSAGAGENFGPIIVQAIYQPVTGTSVDFRVRAQRVGGSGSSNVLGGSSSSPMYLIVEGIGW